jgi:hypothetical protein
MRNATRHWRILLPALLAGIVLRAVVPAGYMPAAPGTGLLFELCHDGVPAGFMAALKGHGHHDHHGGHEDHGSAGDCSIGHILALALADAPDVPDLPVLPAAAIYIAMAPRPQPVSRPFAYTARGPPLP